MRTETETEVEAEPSPRRLDSREEKVAMRKALYAFLAVLALAGGVVTVATGVSGCRASWESD